MTKDSGIRTPRRDVTIPALMLVDIVNPSTALTYAWKHFIGGHMGQLGTRADVATHRQYRSDIVGSSRKALDTVDPTPYLVKYGEHTWAGLRDYLDAVTAAASVIEKYTGVLAAVHVYTGGTTFDVIRSMRFDLGYGSYARP